MIRLAMDAPVTPELTVKTEKLLPGPPPLTVTRLVGVAALPVVGPVIVVFDGMFSPLVN